MNELKASIGCALDWCERQHARIDPALADLAVYHGIKTAAYYIRVINQWLADLYRHDVTEGQFVDRFADLIQQQLTRAWSEGMRAAGVDPSEMTEEMQGMLTEFIASEYGYVDGFAADIASGKYSLAQLQNRAGLWGNRYNEVVNAAKLASADLKDKFEWVYGDTEHCETCAQLNGLVATAKEWEISGIKPQSPPNESLSCGGWKCQCKLQPTERRRSPKVLDTLLTIGVRS